MFKKVSILVYKFFHSGHPSYFGSLFFLLIVEDIVQDTTIQIKGSWGFLNSVHLYINKKHFGHSFAFDDPMVWNHLPDEIRSAPTLACFRKRLKSYLFKKAFPT